MLKKLKRSRQKCLACSELEDLSQSISKLAERMGRQDSNIRLDSCVVAIRYDRNEQWFLARGRVVMTDSDVTISFLSLNSLPANVDISGITESTMLKFYGLKE